MTTTKIEDLGPADEGIIAVTMDDCRNQGLGDDGTFDQVYAALVFEAGFNSTDAEVHAYQAVHGGNA